MTTDNETIRSLMQQDTEEILRLRSALAAKEAEIQKLKDWINSPVCVVRHDYEANQRALSTARERNEEAEKHLAEYITSNAFLRAALLSYAVHPDLPCWCDPSGSGPHLPRCAQSRAALSSQPKAEPPKPTLEQIEEAVKRAQAHCKHDSHGQRLCAGCAAAAAHREIRRTSDGTFPAADSPTTPAIERDIVIQPKPGGECCRLHAPACAENGCELERAIEDAAIEKAAQVADRWGALDPTRQPREKDVQGARRSNLIAKDIRSLKSKPQPKEPGK